MGVYLASTAPHPTLVPYPCPGFFIALWPTHLMTLISTKYRIKFSSYTFAEKIIVLYFRVWRQFTRQRYKDLHTSENESERWDLCDNFSSELTGNDSKSKVLLDQMHLVLAREFLRRLKIWLDHQSDNRFLSHSKDEVDAALLSVKFPHDFNRKLRPIDELKRWKDRELQSFFLHASLPILRSFFPDNYFWHFALLNCHRYLVADKWHYYRQWHRNCQTTCTKLSVANTKLVWRNEETYTCHALGHLPDQVRDHNPLAAFQLCVWSHDQSLEVAVPRHKRNCGTNLLLAQNSRSFIKDARTTRS